MALIKSTSKIRLTIVAVGEGKWDSVFIFSSISATLL